MKIVTHSGAFHTDDIFAVATLFIKYPNAEVVRSRDEEVIESGDVVVDVGLAYDPDSQRFDHHQPGGAGKRENGIPYASFGLVWKEFGSEIAGGDEVAKLIDDKLVAPIDAPDNGVSTYNSLFEGVMPYTIGDFLYSYFSNDETDDQKLYEMFMSSVVIARDLLLREIAKAQGKAIGMKKVREVFEKTLDKRVIVLEDKLPWEPVLVKESEALFVIYERKEGNWGVKGIPTTLGSFERKKFLPESWAGKEGEEFQQISGVSDAIFCHRGMWLAAAQTKEGAMKLAEIALNT